MESLVVLLQDCSWSECSSFFTTSASSPDHFIDVSTDDVCFFLVVWSIPALGRPSTCQQNRMVFIEII